MLNVTEWNQFLANFKICTRSPSVRTRLFAVSSTEWMKILKDLKIRAQYCLPYSVEIELSGKISNRLILRNANNNAFELLVVFLMEGGLISVFSLSFFRLSYVLSLQRKEMRTKKVKL